jgi:type IV pilus assembly protein PilW
MNSAMRVVQFKLRGPRPLRGRQGGFSLIELMVAATIGLVIVAALVAVFVNSSRSNRELARANGMIESGRLALQVLENDVVHGGFWGSFVPQFDDQTLAPPAIPNDVPAAVPDPCLAYSPSNWNDTYKTELLGIPVQAYETPPSSCAAVVTDQEAGTDVLVTRHADTCVPGQTTGAGTCDAAVNGMLYFQGSRCWATTETIRYRFGAYGTDPFDLHERDCTTIAELRRFVSHIYYVRNYAVDPGDSIPTLVRSEFGPGAALGHQAAVPMVEGIQAFRVELGVDNRSKAYAGFPTGKPVDYTDEIRWVPVDERTNPTNRGDGAPDGDFVHCTDAVPCNVAQLMNVTTVKLWVLARSREESPDYVDTKKYLLSSNPSDPLLGPYNDHFKRHLFVVSVRLPNVAGRRETP